MGSGSRVRVHLSEFIIANRVRVRVGVWGLGSRVWVHLSEFIVANRRCEASETLTATALHSDKEVIAT